MPLLEKSFDDFVNDQVNAMQAVASRILNFSDGSIFRAFVESNAGNSIWLESIVAYLLSVTRLQTSFGNDVDTFVGQFQLTRNPATPAFGLVTFSRSVTDQAAIIPAGDFDTSISQGALVYSGANQVTYSVYIDTTNPNYNPDLVAYIIPISVASANIPVVALMPGSIGNALANQITTISSAISYVDRVTNPSDFTNGQDQESDAALKVRFVLYLNSLSKATEQALQAAILSIAGVKRYLLVENQNLDTSTHYGFFYAVVDDGTGHASSELQGNVQAILYATRGLTIAFSVYPPTPVTIDYIVHVFTDGSVPDATVQAAVVSALETYLSTRTFNDLYAWSDIPRIIYDVNNKFVNPQSLSPILNVKNWTQNGATDDIILTGTQIGVPGTITVVMNA